MIRRFAPALAAFVLAMGCALLATRYADSQTHSDEKHLCPLLLVPRHLEMTPEQRGQVEELSAKFQRECRSLRLRMREHRRDLFRLLAEPRPDETAIAARMGEIAGLQAALQQRMVRHLLAVREILTPEQQRKLFDLLDEAMQEDLRRIE